MGRGRRVVSGSSVRAGEVGLRVSLILARGSVCSMMYGLDESSTGSRFTVHVYARVPE